MFIWRKLAAVVISSKRNSFKETKLIPNNVYNSIQHKSLANTEWSVAKMGQTANTLWIGGDIISFRSTIKTVVITQKLIV